jgi:predicted MPP superfamily phosphohydrolase
MISRRRFMTLGAAAAGSGLVGALYAFAIEPGFSLVVKEWAVRHRSWPRDAAPLRIGIMTDLHAVEPWMPARRIGAIVERLNRCKPDIIVLLGDYVNALRLRFHTALVPVAEWMAPLKELHAPLGVYAVLGNHDWWSGEAPLIRRSFEKAHIHVLENAAVRIKWGQDRFWIAGLGDQLAFRSHGADDLDGTLSQLDDTSPALLLAHEPYIFTDVPPRITLTLAGHTHGGQVYVPFVGRPAVPTQFKDYAYGHVEAAGRHMIVSSGLGVSNLPVRFLVPPEIALVTLSHAEGSVNLKDRCRHVAQHIARSAGPA